MSARDRWVAHLRARAEWTWAPLLYAALVAYLYRPVWTGEIGFGWDTIETYWSDLAYLSGELARGSLPLWNPLERGGYPFHADPQPGIFYPIHWLFAAAGALVGGVSWWLIQVKMLLHHVIAGAGMHLFLRSRGLPRSAAIVGGLAWVVSAPMMMHKASNILMPLAWTPLIWVMIDRAIERPGWRRGAALAAALYLAGSAGSPPGFFYTLLVAAAYGLYRGGTALFRAWRTGGGDLGGRARELLLCGAVAAAVTVSLLLVIVVPGLELAEHTPRAERGLAYALGLPLPLSAGLAGLLQPSLGDGQVYMGVAVVMLALVAVAVRPRRDGGAPLFFFFAAAFFLCLAFGGQTPLLPWLVEKVPGFGLFRIAHRYKLAFAPLFAALAGYGAAALFEAGRERPRELLLACLAAATVLAAAAVLVAGGDFDPGGPALPASRTTVFALVAGALVAGAAFHARRAAAILVAVLAAVVFHEVPHFRAVDGPIMEERPRPDLALLDDLEGLEGEWRLFDEYAIGQRPGARFRVRELRGYPSGDPLDLRRYADLRAFAAKEPAILADFNVRYILHAPHHRNRMHLHLLKRPPDLLAPAHFRRLDRRRFEALHPAPLVAYYGAAAVVEEPSLVLARMIADHGDEGARRRAFLEPASAAAMPAAIRRVIEAAGAPGADAPEAIAGELLGRSANEVRVRVRAPAPGLVVLNEVDYPGWRVWVNGEPAAPLIANHLLRAVAVEEGEQEIVWRYRPRGFLPLALLWCAGIVTLLAAALWRGRRREEEPALERQA